jgi:hypothetical protein
MGIIVNESEFIHSIIYSVRVFVSVHTDTDGG